MFHLCYGIFVSSPNSYVGILIPSWWSQEVGLSAGDQFMRAFTLVQDLCPHKRPQTENFLPVSSHVRMLREVSSLQPRRGPSAELDHASTLLWSQSKKCPSFISHECVLLQQPEQSKTIFETKPLALGSCLWMHISDVRVRDISRPCFWLVWAGGTDQTIREKEVENRKTENQEVPSPEGWPPAHTRVWPSAQSLHPAKSTDNKRPHPELSLGKRRNKK